MNIFKTTMRSTIINKYTQVFPDILGPSEKKDMLEKTRERFDPV